MTHRYLIDEPADLAAIFAERAAHCHEAANVASAKAIAAQWTIRAETFETCAGIARRAVLTGSVRPARTETPADHAGTSDTETAS